MKTGRLEAFSDGVLAIIITIMVLELKSPHSTNMQGMLERLPIFLSYIMSFIYVGIYWNNHHHLFQVTEKVNGKILWANLHLLFWLSLIPFATTWIAENHFESIPVAFYGFILLMSGIAYTILAKVIADFHGKESRIHTLISWSLKETISFVSYIIGIVLSFFNPHLGIACFVIVAIIWFIPSKKLEKHAD